MNLSRNVVVSSKDYAHTMNVRMTTSKEIDVRKVELCYWCPERYNTDHRCRGKQFFMIEVWEDHHNMVETELAREGEERTADDTLEISIHVISGTLGCSTIKVEGRVNNKKLQLLID